MRFQDTVRQQSAACLSRFLTLGAAAALLAGLITSSGQADDVVPHWLWSAERTATPGDVVLQKTFSLERTPAEAELYVAADFCRAVVKLNGTTVATIEPYADPQRLDVLAQLQLAGNELRIEAEAAAGPAAVAASLQLREADGTPRVLVTDPSWEVSTPPSQSPAAAASYGALAAIPWQIAPDAIHIHPFDDYEQWKQALANGTEATPTAFLTMPGFEVDVLRVAGPDEGSWVSLVVDPGGRLVIGKEDRGLLRVTLDASGQQVAQVEVINDELQECRGLLFAHGALYANANNSKGLYRLRDTNSDDQFDEVRLLYESAGGVGHGRNCLALGPDGWIYSIHGDSVDMPAGGLDRTSPFRAHRRGQRSQEGHLIRVDPDGQSVELLAAGLRNPFGIDFDQHGEIFTYDADAEFDMGSPWYRPTRVNHVVSGSDFGWRAVTGSWPPYDPDHPDNAPPTLDIGKGSPTAVKFGYRSSFPPAYRRALYILDWAYGRILAVHLTSRGASYYGQAETFLRGRPLNVTGLDFAADGGMYFVTGGRKTQSGLYRVRYTGPRVDDPLVSPQDQARAEQAAVARARRRELESLHQPLGAAAVDQAWPYLADVDPLLRYSARIAVEHQPVELWRERALAEREPLAALTAWAALLASDPRHEAAGILEQLNQLPLNELAAPQWSLALYLYEQCLAAGEANSNALAAAARQLRGVTVPPAAAMPADARRLRELLIRLADPDVVANTVAGLHQTLDQTDHLHRLFALRGARQGWTMPLRREYFRALRETDHYLGGQGMPGFLDQIRQDAVAGLPDTQRQELGELLQPADNLAEGEPLPPRPLVREWQVADLRDALDAVGRDRDYDQGARMYSAALCDRCHRLGSVGRPIGPDLSSVAARFSRINLLESIVEPSRAIAENYQMHRVVTTSGKVLEGRVVHAGDYREPVLKLATDPHAPARLIEVAKAEIESYSVSPVSFMPQGLLNTLTRDEILDLLAYLEAGGRRQHPNFSPPQAGSVERTADE